MKRTVFLVLALALLATNLFARSEDSLRFGRFGKVMLYRQSPTPSHVVLFVSGDGGWNLGVVDMARELASLDALVVGIDIIHYLKQLESSTAKCSYPAADFEALSQFVQKQFNYASYVTPVLVGYSSGATLVYATLVQAPTTTFRGAISLGFCPDLPLTKNFCLIFVAKKPRQFSNQVLCFLHHNYVDKSIRLTAILFRLFSKPAFGISPALFITQ